MSKCNQPDSKLSGLERQGRRWRRFGRYVFVALVFVQLMIVACATTDKGPRRQVTPLTESPSGIYHPGKFVWNDLLTDDLAAAKDFYGGLFGWDYEDFIGYTLVKNRGKRIAGIAQVREGSKNAGAARWLCALSVADVDRAVVTVTEAGGSVLEGPLDMLSRGRGVLVRDPQGAQLVLLHALGGDPEDHEPAIDSWLWHELWSNNTEASLAFYQELSGYEFLGEMDDYLILLKDEQWRAGIRYVDDSQLEMRWVPVVRVTDTEEIAARAKKLGGRVVVDPRPTADGGSVSLLADPSGALFLIQRWSAPPSGQEQ